MLKVASLVRLGGSTFGVIFLVTFCFLKGTANARHFFDAKIDLPFFLIAGFYFKTQPARDYELIASI